MFSTSHLLILLTATFCASIALASMDEPLTPSAGDSSPSGSVPSQDDLNSANENVLRRALSQMPGRILGRLVGQGNTREEVESLRQALNSKPEHWSQLSSAPGAQPNCYVEVQVTQRVPGRCTKLGGRIPACQAQELITIDYNNCE